MLRRVRDKLRMIRYYSAQRARNNWTRAADAAFIASFLAALPAAWACDAIIMRPSPAISVTGQFFRTQDGVISALILTPVSDDVGSGQPAGQIHGSFVLEVEDQFHGWPLITSIHRQRAQVDIDIPSETRRRQNVQLPPDDPMRRALERALDRSGQHEALEALRQAGAQVRQSWFAWPIAAGIWWIAMALGSSLVINMMRLMASNRSRSAVIRRARLRNQNKCPGCGYDMTGLEFNERCPECGTIVW